MLLTVLRKTLFLSSYLEVFDFRPCSSCLGLCDSCAKVLLIPKVNPIHISQLQGGRNGVWIGYSQASFTMLMNFFCLEKFYIFPLHKIVFSIFLSLEPFGMLS